MRGLLLPLLLALAGCATPPGSRDLTVLCHTVDPPVQWDAVSGLSMDRHHLYAVHDHNRPNPEILVLRLTSGEASIVRRLPLLDQAGYLDLEGISRREGSGFWAVSEGRGRQENRLLRIDADGVVAEQVRLPHSVRIHRRKGGFEGVAARGRDPNEEVVVAFQHPWKDDPPGTVKLGRYWPMEKRWELFRYPLDDPRSGLSALAFLPDGRLAVLERDNKPLFRAKIKRIYVVELPHDALPGKPLEKRLLLDLLQWRGHLLQCGTNGKFEGLAAAGPRHLFLVADDDGDASARILELTW